MSEKPISPLRRCMIEDMSVCNFVDKTRNDYIRHAKIAPLFDGSQQLIAVTSVPWYARQVSLPGS